MTRQLLVAELHDDFVAQRRVMQGGGGNTSASRACEQSSVGIMTCKLNAPLNEAEHYRPSRRCGIIVVLARAVSQTP